MRRRPNILWLLTDEQRKDSLGCYGSPWASTPHLDRLAAAGTVFTNAITPSPVCLPARTSMLTGRYPAATGVWANHAGTPAPQPLLTNIFRDAGYRTASFGKQHYLSTQTAFEREGHHVLSDAVHYFHLREGLDPADYDVMRYPPEPYPWIFAGRFPGPASETAEATAVEEALRWLGEHPADDPFLLRVSFNAPHTPVIPPEPYDRLVDPDAISLGCDEASLGSRPRWIHQLAEYCRSDRLSAGEIRAMRRAYYGTVAFVDALCGRLIGWLEEHRVLDDTIVVFTSDHGTHLGDFGLVQKQTFYEPVVGVPFMFWAPGLVRSARLHTPVGIHSLLPTLLDLAALDVPDGLDAPSLAGSLTSGDEPSVGSIFSELTLGTFGLRHDDRLVYVRDGGWTLSMCLDPEPHDVEMFDLATDPCQRTNLAGDPAHAQRRRGLEGVVLQHMNLASPERSR